MNIFVTGHTSGLGKAIAIHAINNNLSVFGLSRSELHNENIIQQKCNFETLEKIPIALTKFPFKKNVDLVVLNAAELGQFHEFEKIKVNNIKKVLNINTWSNKIIVDFFIEKEINIKQLIFITSGASLRSDNGWGSYTISKLVINKFAEFYAQTLKNTHVCALSPGMIDTKMQKELRRLSSSRFPSIDRLKNAFDDNKLPSAEFIAQLLLSKLKKIRQHKSGSFIKLISL